MAFFKNATDLARALQVTAVRKKGQAGGVRVKDILERSKLRAGSFDELFPATISIDGGDISILIDKSLTNNNITQAEAILIKQAYKETVEVLAANSPVLTTDKFDKIVNAINDFVTFFNNTFNDPAQEVSNALSAQLTTKLNAITSSIGSKTLYKVQYIPASNPTEIGSLVLASSGYKNTQEINNILKTKLQNLINQYTGAADQIKNIKDSNYLTKVLQNWGHSLAEVEIIDPETGEITVQKRILTGKLVATLLSTGKNSINESTAEIIASNFIQTTGQVSSSVSVLNTGNSTNNDPGTLKLVISSGYFQNVKVQFGKENLDQAKLEKQWSLGVLLENNTFLLKNVSKALGLEGTPSVIRVINSFIRVSSSPTYIDKVVNSALSPLIKNDKKLKFTPKNISLLNSTHTVSQIFGKTKNKGVSTSVSKPKSIKLKKVVQKDNIFSILDLINASLFEQIKKNMGTGNRRDVLNFRTGRLARSAKIERISESRQGMITAFYSYMKNPYATFSEGGRQQFPRSRDPKLLISKSIREIAAPLVTNRLRAVNV